MDSQASANASINRPIALVKGGGGIIGEFFRSIGDHIPNIVDLAFGVGTMVWIYYLIKIPWGLYFKARKGRIDGQESKANGIEQDDESIYKLYSIEQRLLVASIAAHVFSALGVYGISYLTGGRWIRPHTSFLFLGSAILRPAWEFHFHVRTRIEQLIRRIQYPKAYIEKLLDDVDNLKRNETKNENEVKSIKERHQADIRELHSKLDTEVADINQRHAQNIQRITDKQQQDYRHMQDQVHALQTKIQEMEVNSKKSSEKTVFYFERLEQEFNDALSKLSADKKNDRRDKVVHATGP